MKQLYFTSCRQGRSVSGDGGFKIRALTPGGDRRLEKFATYDRPHQTIDTNTAPVRLAFFRDEQGGLVLCHTEYVGEDPMTNRPGNFFTHLLSDLPDTHPRDAIQTWNASFWQKYDGDFPLELPELEKLAPGDLQLENVKSVFGDQPSREIVLWTLAAILAPQKPHKCQIILAANTDTIAWTIFAVLHLLPKSLTGDLTFSTYEKAPLSSLARIVGAWPGDASGISDDLPSNFYSGERSLAFHQRRGRKSEFEEHPYVQTVRQAFDSQEPDRIFEWITGLDSIENLTFETFEVLHKVESSCDLNPADTKTVLHIPEYRDKIVSRPGIGSKLAALAFDPERPIDNNLRDAILNLQNQERDEFHRIGRSKLREAIEGENDELVSQILGEFYKEVSQDDVYDWIHECESLAESAPRMSRFWILRTLSNREPRDEHFRKWLEETPIIQIEPLLNKLQTAQIRLSKSEELHLLKRAVGRGEERFLSELGNLLRKQRALLPELMGMFEEDENTESAKLLNLLQGSGLLRETLIDSLDDPATLDRRILLLVESNRNYTPQVLEHLKNRNRLPTESVSKKLLESYKELIKSGGVSQSKQREFTPILHRLCAVCGAEPREVSSAQVGSPERKPSPAPLNSNPFLPLSLNSPSLNQVATIFNSHRERMTQEELREYLVMGIVESLSLSIDRARFEKFLTSIRDYLPPVHLLIIDQKRTIRPRHEPLCGYFLLMSKCSSSKAFLKNTAAQAFLLSSLCECLVEFNLPTYPDLSELYQNIRKYGGEESVQRLNRQMKGHLSKEARRIWERHTKKSLLRSILHSFTSDKRGLYDGN